MGRLSQGQHSEIVSTAPASDSRKCGQGNCFPLPVADGCLLSVPNGAAVRQQAHAFIVANPRRVAVQNLPAADRADINFNGREMTDAQARIVACALQLDLLILDQATSTFRYINSDGSGVRYLNEAQGIRLLRSRHADAADRHSIILYTRGHYRGLRWQ